jgi:hypothetical protein
MFRQLLGIFGAYSTGKAIGLAATGRPENLATKIVYHGLAAGARAEREQERERTPQAPRRAPRRFAP